MASVVPFSPGAASFETDEQEVEALRLVKLWCLAARLCTALALTLPGHRFVNMNDLRAVPDAVVHRRLESSTAKRDCWIQSGASARAGAAADSSDETENE